MKTISNSPLWKNRLQEKPGSETETPKKGFRETVNATLICHRVLLGLATDLTSLADIN